jgi:large subunit ribosomal protein L35
VDASYTARLSPRVRPIWHAESRVSTDPKEETEMPKMKTKSSCKKRFKVTATGRILAGQAGKRHGMIKRSNKFLRNARGTTTLCKADEGIIKPMMPYAR